MGFWTRLQMEWIKRTQKQEPVIQKVQHDTREWALNHGLFLQELVRSKQEMDRVRSLFDQVSDPALVDEIVFRVGAAEQHFNYLIHLARQFNISFDGMQWEWVADA